MYEIKGPVVCITKWGLGTRLLCGTRGRREKGKKLSILVYHYGLPPEVKFTTGLIILTSNVKVEDKACSVLIYQEYCFGLVEAQELF